MRTNWSCPPADGRPSSMFWSNLQYLLCLWLVIAVYLAVCGSVEGEFLPLGTCFEDFDISEIRRWRRVIYGLCRLLGSLRSRPFRVACPTMSVNSRLPDESGTGSWCPGPKRKIKAIHRLRGGHDRALPRRWASRAGRGCGARRRFPSTRGTRPIGSRRRRAAAGPTGAAPDAAAGVAGGADARDPSPSDGPPEPAEAEDPSAPGPPPLFAAVGLRWPARR